MYGEKSYTNSSNQTKKDLLNIYWIANLFFILLVSTVVNFNLIPGLVSVLLFITVYTSTALLHIYSDKNPFTFKIDRVLIISIGLIIILHSVNFAFLRIQELTNFVPPIVMVAIFLINLFIIPRNVSLHDFLYVLSRFSLFLCVIGLLALPFLNYDWVYYNLFRGGAGARKLGPFIPRPTSILHNPNNLAKVLFAGSVATAGLYFENKNQKEILVFIVIIITLLLTQSRASWVAAVISLIVLLLNVSSFYKRFWNMLMLAIVSVLIITLPIFYSIIFSPTVDFSNRTYLWDATIAAIQQGPLTGYGFGTGSTYISEYLENPSQIGTTPHNSFLYTSLRLGLIGGITYIFLCSYAVYTEITKRKTRGALVALGIGFLIIQTFDGVSALFLGIESFLHAIVLGYMLITTQKTEE